MCLDFAGRISGYAVLLTVFPPGRSATPVLVIVPGEYIVHFDHPAPPPPTVEISPLSGVERLLKFKPKKTDRGA
mgnify:CR=1 FL=1